MIGIESRFTIRRNEDLCIPIGKIEPCKACWACGGQKNCVHRKGE